MLCKPISSDLSGEIFLSPDISYYLNQFLFSKRLEVMKKDAFLFPLKSIFNRLKSTHIGLMSLSMHYLNQVPKSKYLNVENNISDAIYHES
jgi:hypothetical protein